MENENNSSPTWIYSDLPPQAQQPLPMPPDDRQLLEEPPSCAGCSFRIVDKFYLSALDSKWHTLCLKCSECSMPLELQSKCYERDGLILCKEDYLR